MPNKWTFARDAVPEGIVQYTVYEEGTGTTVATVFSDPSNAPLISAAPDILAALEGLLAHRETPQYSPEARAAREAIEKAYDFTRPRNKRVAD